MSWLHDNFPELAESLIIAIRDEVLTWPEDEKDFLRDMLFPEPEPATKKPQKKPAKKSSSKSPRASGMAAAAESKPEAAA